MTAVAPYVPATGYDELVEPAGNPRPLARPLLDYMARTGMGVVIERQEAAEAEVRSMGVTFRSGTSSERPWPFDVIPRLVSFPEWQHIETGLTQRVRALNCFVGDMYHEQRILQSGVVPIGVVRASPNFRSECVGVDPPGGIWVHICGSDIIRGAEGTLYVLEDNLRVPSGVAYLLENRLIAKRVFPELFRHYSIEPVDHYVTSLADVLSSVAPVGTTAARVVVLTPGPANSAYHEHAYLAQQLGADLVEGRDLVVTGDRLYVHTIGGAEPVDVVYRRIDDLYLDPEVFIKDSVIGVPGIMRAWRAGNVAIVNAPGTGVADDKAVYPYVSDMIRYYLEEEPVLPSVPTWRCADEFDRRHVLEHLADLVVKPSNEAGGYGIVIGPQSGSESLRQVADLIERFPPGWVAQPVVNLSTMPTLCTGEIQPRHVDLRPFTLLGPNGAYVVPGGLTRVARDEGSLIVNSSQGGGSKDTWVIRGVVDTPIGDGDPRGDRGSGDPEGTWSEGADNGEEESRWADE